MNFSPHPHFSTDQKYNPKKMQRKSVYDNQDVEKYFNKKFSFKWNDDWNLPEADCFYRDERWYIAELQTIKDELNKVKDQLDEFDLSEWSLHTKRRDISSSIFGELKKCVKPELLTQAWCKFYEILNQFDVIPEYRVTCGVLNSVHLCEAPGAFISSLNHYLTLNHSNLQWNWIANSLNPEYEGNSLSQMISDKRLICHTRNNWYFGVDTTGDIMQYYNHVSLLEAAEKYKEIMLVTADGSIDCMSNPDEQERLVEHLHFCEFFTALSILSEGGSFVIKIFTSFEDSTICLLYILNYYFSSVHVFKPCTSKSGNSEVYVICLKFKCKKICSNIWEAFIKNYKNPQRKAMLPLESIPDEFLSQIETLSVLFMQEQTNTINQNIYYFRNMDLNEIERNTSLKAKIATHFINKYKIKPILNRLVYNNVNSKTISRVMNCKVLSDFIENINDLEIVIGKQFKMVNFSEFCDTDLLQKLSYISDKKYPSGMYLDVLKIDTVRYKVSHIFYDCDNSHYKYNVFDNFYSLLKSLKLGNHVILTGYIFLTRFEVGLLYLLMLCFGTVDYFENGVIILSNCNSNVKNILEYFRRISEDLSNVNNSTVNGLKLSVLNVVGPMYIFNERFQKGIKNYNKTMINFSLQEFDLVE